MSQEENAGRVSIPLQRELGAGLEMKNVFVVAAKRNSGLALKSFHENICLANKAMLNTIDIDALQVIPAKIQFAKNGNVRLWCSVVA